MAKARPGKDTLGVKEVRFAHGTAAIKKGATATATVRVVQVRVKARSRATLRARYGSIVNPGVRAPRSTVLSLTGPAGNPSTVVLKGHVILAVGSILSLPPGDLLSRGLLSRVEKVTYTKGATTVNVSAASPYEVAPVLAFEVPATAQTESSTRSACTGVSGVSPYRTITGIVISGGWNTIRVLRQDIPIGVRLKVHFTAKAGINVTGGLGLSCSLSASVSANGMAGPIPVTAGIEGTLSAFAGIGGKLNTGGSLQVDAGASTIGTPPALLWVPSLSFSNPSFTFTAQKFAEASAGIGMAVKAGIGNDYVASATIKFGASTNFTAQPERCPWEAKFGQFSAAGQLAGLPIENPKTPAPYPKALSQNACGTPSPDSPIPNLSASTPPTTPPSSPFFF